MPICTDRLIDNLKMQWLTGTATSVARLYRVVTSVGNSALGEWIGQVPTGLCGVSDEPPQRPRVWAEGRYGDTLADWGHSEQRRRPWGESAEVLKPSYSTPRRCSERLN